MYLPPSPASVKLLKGKGNFKCVKLFYIREKERTNLKR